ncbi:putative Transmembrane protein [Melia azedarach]|uniref:Transmembrane protein n=1 Tax=Melia azedarach TaxID=155640 RepID=A0ACC1X833_MELAZ|nr:putative Transmembrane protein [Melia azedarach]
MVAVISLREKTYLSAAIMLALLLILNSISVNRASSFSCNGSIHGCLIADNDDATDFEFLMDSHSGRMLIDFRNAAGGTGNKDQVAVDCGRYKPYDNCLPDKNGNKKPENPGIYNRGNK